MVRKIENLKQFKTGKKVILTFGNEKEIFEIVSINQNSITLKNNKGILEFVLK